MNKHFTTGVWINYKNNLLFVSDTQINTKKKEAKFFIFFLFASNKQSTYAMITFSWKYRTKSVFPHQHQQDFGFKMTSKCIVYGSISWEC